MQSLWRHVLGLPIPSVDILKQSFDQPALLDTQFAGYPELGGDSFLVTSYKNFVCRCLDLAMAALLCKPILSARGAV